MASVFVIHTFRLRFVLPPPLADGDFDNSVYFEAFFIRVNLLVCNQKRTKAV
jgi:hypothetical protein